MKDIRWIEYLVTADTVPIFGDQPVLRPVIDVTIEGPEHRFQKVSLVADSGSEYTLISSIFARRVGIEISSLPTDDVRIGGR